MAINLGDVNFNIGADLTGLSRSVQQVSQFGRVVDQATAASDQFANALRRQEKAAGDALLKVQGLTSQMNKVKGSSQYINQANQAYSSFASTVTRGALSSLEMQRAQERLRASLATTNTAFKTYADGIKKAEAGSSSLFQGLKNIQAAAVLSQGPLGGLAFRLSTFTSLVGQSGFALAAFTAGASAAVTILYKLGSAAADVGAKFLGYKSSLTAVTGSTTEANKELETAIKISRQAGVEIQGIIPAFTKFTAAAEGTSLQGEKAQKIFSNFAKAASVLNLSTEDTAGIFKALEQMISKGTVQAEELRGQLGDRLPGAFQLAARAMGVTTAKLGDMMKKGQVITDEFLPKLSDELQRTFNLPSGNIDTYASSIGNLKNSITLLLNSINEKFDLTGKIQEFAKSATTAFDWLRTNLDEVVAKVAIFGSAFALALGGGLPALAALGAAIYKFGDQITVLEGQAGTLKDYMVITWRDLSTQITTLWNTALAQMKADIDYLAPNISESFKQLVPDASSINDKVNGWIKAIQDPIDSALNGLINGSVAAFNGLAASWDSFPAAVASAVIEAINFMIRTVNTGLNALASGVNAAIAGINKVTEFFGGKGLDVKFDINIPEVENRAKAAGAKAGAAFDKAWSETPTVDYMGKVNKGLEKTVQQSKEYTDSVRQRANAEATARNSARDALAEKRDAFNNSVAQTNEMARQEKLAKSLAQIGADDGVGGGGGKKRKGGGAKAAERAATATDNILEAIRRAQEEIDTLSDGGNLKLLNEEFKRQDEVKKYGDALRKAGVDAEWTKQKTGELYDLLKQRDALKQAQEGAQQWSDALSKSVDFFGESLVDLAFEGKDAFKSIGEAAKSLAKDLTNTFIQLTLTNPLKNLLFGQNNPTLGIGGGGGGGILSSLFGGLFGGGKSFVPNTTFGAFLGLRKGGAVDGGFAPYGSFQKAAHGIINKPTMLSTPSGAVQAGEAGAEAILPLSRDSSGSLGVAATLGGGGGGNVIVNVNCPPGSTATSTQSQNASGDTLVDIVVQKAYDKMTADMAKGGTPINKSTEGRYGLTASSGLKGK